ncbi:MAG: hypothetical protein SH868_20250 [Bythopirellula sp.]|nr:hypothetical protein [Bythopirellula sp.]
MNEVYFACPNCRFYIDAGYRWAYWLLEEPGIVQRGEGVDVEVVFSCDEYWYPPAEECSEWLCEKILPSVRKFLEEHRSHGIVYIEEEHILAEQSIQYNWSKLE